jgi:hypothetical protein
VGSYQRETPPGKRVASETLGIAAQKIDCHSGFFAQLQSERAKQVQYNECS